MTNEKYNNNIARLDQSRSKNSARDNAVFSRAKYVCKEGDGESDLSRYKCCDLHTHSTASDGELNAKELVRWAKSKGIEVLALTDHDSIDGLDEARIEADKQGIVFVPGIELSTYSICEIHILGYNIDYHNQDFVNELVRIKGYRKERNSRIVDNLAKLGIVLDNDYTQDGMGRKHIAKEMVAKGYCQDVGDAFDRYIGVRGKAYCDVKRLTPIEAVQLIAKYGGVSSIAHPKRYLLDNRLDSLISGLKAHGLDGLELYYPSHTEGDIASLQSLARKYNLIATGGSDYHGEEDRDFTFAMSLKTLKILHL